jgi:hypothetical protein
LALRPTILDGHVLALDKTNFIQSLMEADDKLLEAFARSDVQKPNHWHRRLLRSRRYRPRRRTAEKRDELSPPDVAHTIFLQPGMVTQRATGTCRPVRPLSGYADRPASPWGGPELS